MSRVPIVSEIESAIQLQSSPGADEYPYQTLETFEIFLGVRESTDPCRLFTLSYPSSQKSCFQHVGNGYRTNTLILLRISKKSLFLYHLSFRFYTTVPCFHYCYIFVQLFCFCFFAFADILICDLYLCSVFLYMYHCSVFVSLFRFYTTVPFLLYCSVHSVFVLLFHFLHQCSVFALLFHSFHFI